MPPQRPIREADIRQIGCQGRLQTTSGFPTCLREHRTREILSRAMHTVSVNQRPVPVLVHLNLPRVTRLGSQTQLENGHFLSLVGRQKFGPECGYWFRNSYPCVDPLPDDLSSQVVHRCDLTRPGMVWIPESVLALPGGVDRAFFLSETSARAATGSR